MNRMRLMLAMAAITANPVMQSMRNTAFNPSIPRRILNRLENTYSGGDKERIKRAEEKRIRKANKAKKELEKNNG